MNLESYLLEFQHILNSPTRIKPYTDDTYVNYVKINLARTERWLKKGILHPDLVHQIKQIQSKQTWVIITEPWCGDAAHTIPFIVKLAAENPLIEVEFQLRDTNSEMEKYLTHGTKSIPILIIRDSDQKDLAVWGPRPKAAQDLFFELKKSAKTKEEQKIDLQQWYNQDQGKSLQEELLNLIR